MVRKTSDGPATEPLNANFSELTDLGARQFEALAEAQAGFAKRVENMNANWLKRVRIETALVSELTSKLTTARSYPEVAAAWQDWNNRHMELMSEDAKRAACDMKALLASRTRAMSGGWTGVVDSAP